ncbi:phage tail protein [Vibrio fluvialis]|nr:phage tail protein [Vibrio fluvialis]
MSKFFTLLTTVGEAKLANATALGQTVKFEKMAIGDGDGELPVPDQKQTALVNEVRREFLNSVETVPDNPNWIVCEQVIPENVGGWTIREVGIYDIDGDLIAIGNFPETYKPILEEGSGRTQTVRLVLQVSSTATVELKIDPSVVLATREYVDKKDKSHVDASDPHSQYLTRADWLKQMLFKGIPMSAVGHGPDPDIWLPAGRVELLRSEYPTVFEIISASAFFTDQATIDANPRSYAGHWGTGDGATTFTTDDWTLLMNIKVAGGYGAAGSTKEDHIQNILGTFRTATSNTDALLASGAFYRSAMDVGDQMSNTGTALTDEITFDAARVVRTDAYTDTMGLFLDYYRVIPKGVFSYA